MLQLVVFTKEEDLKELTGLSRQAMQEKGFDLDDWNWAIQITQPVHEYVYFDHNDDECHCDSSTFCYREIIWKEGYEKSFGKLSLEEDLECIEYDGKYYYICYH